MNAAETITPTITEPLIWDEICARYPSQWVCVVEIAWDQPKGIHFRSARVVGHGKTGREPLIQARPWRARYRSIGHYFTGPVMAEVEVILFPRFVQAT